MDILSITVMLIAFSAGSLSFIALVILIIMRIYNKSYKNHKPVKHATPPTLRQIPNTISAKSVITHYSDTHDIEQYPSTTAIYKSGQFSASERGAEYRRRGKSPSGVIDGIYNDMYRENGVSYSDVNRDWDADA